MGWMPTALDLSTWNSLWTVARIKESGYHPTLKETKFDFNLQDVFIAWSAGCILQGEYLKYISNEFNMNKDLNYKFLYELISKKCLNIDQIRDFCSTSIKLGIPSPVLSANLAYYDLIFSNHKIGETIQLQRSYFGLHPLKQKNDKDAVKPYWTKL